MNEKKGVILITGCCGRIGFRTAERLLNDYQIIGIDMFLVGFLPGVQLIGIDLGSKKNIDENLDLIKAHFGNRIVSVIHLAAYYSFTKGHWDQYERITVNGTKNLLKGLIDKGFSVEQFIFSSTMLIHAPCEVGQKINEEWPVVPKWNYPKSKVLTEKVIQEVHGKVPYVIMRIAGVYDDHCHSIPLSNQIQRIYENQFEGRVFPGDITHGASFIHMEDLVDALCAAIEKRKELPKELVVLIGEPKTLSYDELQRIISKEIYGKEWKTFSVPKPIAKMGAWMQQIMPFVKKGFIEPWMIDLADDHYELDISKAKKYLNWQPKYELKKVLPKWILELKKDPMGWYRQNKLEIPAKLIKKNHD